MPWVGSTCLGGPCLEMTSPLVSRVPVRRSSSQDVPRGRLSKAHGQVLGAVGRVLVTARAKGLPVAQPAIPARSLPPVLASHHRPFGHDWSAGDNDFIILLKVKHGPHSRCRTRGNWEDGQPGTGSPLQRARHGARRGGGHPDHRRDATPSGWFRPPSP